MSTVEEKITTLRALKGAPLSILVALLVCPTDLALEGWLSSATGYKGNALAVGLADLHRLGYAEHPAGKRYGWRLTSAGRQLPLPLDALPAAPAGTLEKQESRPVVLDGATLEKPESHSQQGAGTFQNPAQFAAAGRDSGKTRVPAPSSSSMNIRGLTQFSDDDGRAGELHEALRVAGVYHNLRAKLAAELLADDQVDWLRHVLGWIADTTSEGAHNSKERGATIYPALKDRRRADDRCLPPAGLPFDDALAWALRGGQDAAPPASNPEPAPGPLDPIYADDALDLSPAEQLWQHTLAALRDDLPAAAFTTWCSNTALTAGDAPEAYRVICATPQQRDWLANRLGVHITRHLRRLTGQAVTITFTAP